MWLPIQGFIDEDTFFLRSDPDTTITEPANAAVPITVSTYNHINNSIYIHSSRGYSRGGLIKPDLAAPGVNVYGPGLSPGGAGETFPMTRRTGSSVAAAHVAGAVADLFTWGIVRGNNPAMSDASVRAYLIRGANRNPAYTYPNRESMLIQIIYILYYYRRNNYYMTINTLEQVSVFLLVITHSHKIQAPFWGACITYIYHSIFFVIYKASPHHTVNICVFPHRWK